MLASDLVLGNDKSQGLSSSNAAGEEDFEDEDEMDYDEEGADGDLQVEEYGGELENSGDADDTD
jgi:hypothetical protein